MVSVAEKTFDVEEGVDVARLRRLREGYKIVEEIRQALRERGIEDEMSMEEIDAEIAAYRKERRVLEGK